jgi:hypothetical protein
MIIVRLDVEGIGELKAPWEVARDAMGGYIGRYALALRKYMRTAAPKGEQRIHPLSKRAPRNRSLASQIRIVKQDLKAGAASFAIIAPTGADYAGHVIFGTRPHQIDIRRAKSLTIWKPEGMTLASGKRIKPDKYGFVHVRSTKHPGSKGNDFRAKAIDAAQSDGVPADQWSKAWDAAWAKRKQPPPLPKAKP